MWMNTTKKAMGGNRKRGTATQYNNNMIYVFDRCFALFDISCTSMSKGPSSTMRGGEITSKGSSNYVVPPLVFLGA